MMIEPMAFRFNAGGRVFLALEERNFRLFWFGQLLSVTGTWMQTVALGWMVLELTDSPLALGLLSVLQFTPVLFFSPFAGVLADRASKRLLLIVAQAGMMVFAFLLGALAMTGHVEFWQVAIITAAVGLCNAVDMPVRQAFVSEMVARDRVLNAVALNSAVFNSARIVGPALSGLLIAWQGPGPSFIINGVTYLAVLAGLLLMRDSELYRHVSTDHGSVLRDLKEGAAYVVRERQIGLVIVLVGGLSIFCMNWNVLLPVFARDVLDTGAIGLGFITTALAIGSLTASLVIASRRAPSIRVLLGGGLALCIAEIGIAGSSWLLVSLPFLAAAGAAMITFANNANSSLQAGSPDHLRGRVMSLYMTVFVGSTPLGGLLMGSLADAFGAQVALGTGAVCGLVVLALAGLPLSHEPANAARSTQPAV